MRIGWENVRGGYYIHKLFGKISALINEINTVKDKALPDVTADDNGKTMIVADGEWSLGEGGGDADQYKLVQITGLSYTQPYYGWLNLYSNGDIALLDITVGNSNGFPAETEVNVGSLPQDYLITQQSGGLYHAISVEDPKKDVYIQLSADGTIRVKNLSDSVINNMIVASIVYKLA